MHILTVVVVEYFPETSQIFLLNIKVEKVIKHYICPSFINLGIVYNQVIRTAIEYLDMTITKELLRVIESSWDKITAGLKFVQCQKLKCALKFLKKIEDDPFLGQPIPINTNIELKENRREKISC